jgi:hypothetical protein
MKIHQAKEYANSSARIHRQTNIYKHARELFKYPNSLRRLLLALPLLLCLTSLAYSAPKLILPPSGLIARSTQFVDNSGYLWGTDTNNGDAARKIVRYAANGSPVATYQSTFTELLKPKGSDIVLGSPTLAWSVITQIWPLPDGNFLFSTRNGNNHNGYLFKLRVAKNGLPVDIVGNNAPNFDNKQAVMNIGERNGVQPSDIRTLHQGSLSVATIDGATVLFFGEYNVNNSRVSAGANDWVGLWKSTDLGDTWSKVIEWNTNGHQVSHIHSVRYNPYNQWVYILFGDSNTESGIVAWDGHSPAPPDNTPLSQMGNFSGWKSIAGSQARRTGDIVFTPTHCVWIPDVDAVPVEGIFGQRANHDLSGHEATGPVPAINKIPPILGYRDSVTGTIFWASFRTEGAIEQKLHLWTSNDDGLNWDLSAKIDNYVTYTEMPHSLFIDSGSELVFSGVLGTDFLNISQPKGSTAYFHVNALPVATSSTASGNQDTPIPLALTGTDSDGTVTQVTLSTLAPAAQGTLFLANGVTPVLANSPITTAQAETLVFKPAANFNGTATLAFTVTDNDGDVSTVASKFITVVNAQETPVATPSTASGNQDTAIPLALTGTDVDGTVTQITLSTLAPAAQGALFLADGTTPVLAGVPIIATQAATLVFKPATNFNGVVTLAFTVTDNDGNISAPANAVITVIKVQKPPVATPTTASGNKNTSIPVALTGTDPDGTVTQVTLGTPAPAAQGGLFLADGTTPVPAGAPITTAQAATLVFKPATDFSGTVTLTFTVTDNDGNVSTAANAVITVINPLNIVSSSLVSRSTQFVDSNGNLWGTDKTNGDAARKIVKFAANGNPVTTYQSTYTELLKPKGSDIALGSPTLSWSTITQIWPLPDGNFLFSTRNGNNQNAYLFKLRASKNGLPADIVGNNAPNFDNKQAVMNIGERNGVQPNNIRTLHQGSLSVATINGATVLFFGEYNVNRSRVSGGANDWVGLWQSTDLGDTWSKVIEWNTNGSHQTSLINSIRYNPYNQWVYILFEDQGIVAWDGHSPAPPDNTPISQMGNFSGWKSIIGSHTRTGDIVFTPTRCVWIPTVDVVPPSGVFGQQSNHDLTGYQATGPVPVINNIPPILGYRDALTGTIYWSSYRIQTATTEQKLHLWMSNDGGISWNLAAKIDNFPAVTAMPHSLFINPANELVFSGILGTDFLNISQPKGSTANFRINNAIPTATPTTASGNKNTSIPVALTGTDPDGTVTQVTLGTPAPAAQGGLFLADGTTPVPAGAPITTAQAATLVFKPATDFSGTVTLTFTVTDNDGNVSTAANAVITVINPLNIVSSSLVSRSTQFVDSNGNLWGTDKTNGDAARKIVKFAANGNPVTTYQSTYTELLKPKGSDIALGSPTLSWSTITQIWPLPDGNFLFSTRNGNNQNAYLFKLRASKNGLPADIVGNNAPNFDNKQAVMNIGERNGVQPNNIRTLHQGSLSVATINGATVLFFGEYNVNRSRVSGGANDWVGLWQSTDLGDTWSKVIEWNTNGSHQTSLINSIRYNPYNQWVYILFEDQGIVAWDGHSPAPPDNTPISQMGNFSGWKSIIGSHTRTGDIVFTPTRCVWIPTVDVVPPSGVFGQQSNHDLTGYQATGPVPVINNIPPILGYRDALTGTIYWSSYRIQTATTEQKLHLWMSNDGGISWNLAAKIDNFPAVTAMPHSLFINPANELVFSGILGTDFLNISQPKGSTANFRVTSP